MLTHSHTLPQAQRSERVLSPSSLTLKSVQRPIHYLQLHRTWRGIHNHKGLRPARHEACLGRRTNLTLFRDLDWLIEMRCRAWWPEEAWRQNGCVTLRPKIGAVGSLSWFVSSMSSFCALIVAACGREFRTKGFKVAMDANPSRPPCSDSG